ncbi:MAG: hypothetical protein AAGD92_12910 [Pseudomonadota bacterium]
MFSVRTAHLKNPRAALRNALLAGAGAFILALVAFLPGSASAHNFHIGDHEELLQDLIDMDAEDIDDLQNDLMEARGDIAEAIGDIEDAKDDLHDAPGGQLIARMAFGAARIAVSKVSGMAFREAREELDKTADALNDRRAEIGELEYAETTGALLMIRAELDAIKAQLDELADALDEI